MGSLLSAVEDLNPLSVIKSTVHDISAFVCNSCRSDCDCCGCWKFGFQTFETHDDQPETQPTVDTSINIAWH